MEPEHSLAVIAGMPAKLNSTVAGLTEEQLRRRPESGEWSIKEVLCHLREAQQVYDTRIRRIANEDEPFLPGWDQEAAAVGYLEQDSALILPDYVASRGALVDFLRSQPEPVWERKGTHEEDGPMTLQQMVLRVAEHEIEHLGQLRRLRAGALGSPTG